MNLWAYRNFSERLASLIFDGLIIYEMNLYTEHLAKFAQTTNFMFRKNCADFKHNHYNVFQSIGANTRGHTQVKHEAWI